MRLRLSSAGVLFAALLLAGRMARTLRGSGPGSDVAGTPGGAAATADVSPVTGPARPLKGLEAFHRSGQTFLTWPERQQRSDLRYRIYRSVTPIRDLTGLEPVGEVGPDSGAYPRQAAIHSPVQQRFIIHDHGLELPPGVGLYVHTPHPSVPARAWYAVGVVAGGVLEPLDPHLTITAPVLEQDGPTAPVLVFESPSGRQRVYTHWIDDTRFHPRLDGYAFNFWVGTPDARPAKPLPLTLHLHAWGESWLRFFDSGRETGSPYGLKTLWLEPDDPSNTWWTGFADRADPDGMAAAGATVVPYTEARLEWMLEWISSPRSGYHVDPSRVYLYGGSMGGSGALSFGLRHPRRFAALYAVTAMTRPGASGWGRPGLDRLFGPLEPPLLLSDATPFYTRQDMTRFLLDHQADDLPFTVTVHGRADTTIEWQTQGLPWLSARAAAAQPGPAVFADGDHSSVFDGYSSALIPNYPPSLFSMRITDSYPVFTAFSGDDDPSSPLPTCRNPDPLYRYGFQGGGLEWGGTGRTVLGRTAPLDTGRRYELAFRIRSDLCALPKTGTVDVTLRRRQAFRPPEGQVVLWEVINAAGKRLQQGRLKVGPGTRLTVPRVRVSTAGVLLRLSSS